MDADIDCKMLVIRETDKKSELKCYFQVISKINITIFVINDYIVKSYFLSLERNKLSKESSSTIIKILSLVTLSGSTANLLTV